MIQCVRVCVCELAREQQQLVCVRVEGAKRNKQQPQFIDTPNSLGEIEIRALL